MKMTNAIWLTSLSIALLSYNHVYAQQNEPVRVNVHYQFKHVYDTGNRANPYTRGMVLHIGETNSKYTDGDAEAAFKAMQKAQENAPAQPAVIVSGKLMANISSISNDVIYQLPYESKLIKLASVANTSYRVEIPSPEIEWKIEKETRKIDSYTCQKAVGNFGGRRYTAWFTTELPFKNGPWKLCGLPGLILEAKDDRDEVFFLFKEISKGEPDERVETPTGRTVTVDEKTFERARKLFTEDPVAHYQSQMPNYKDPISLLYTDPSGKKYWNDEARTALKNDKKINNNPLELPTVK